MRSDGGGPRILDLDGVGDPAVLHDQHPVGQLDGLFHVVGDQQHPESVTAPQLEQQRAHGKPGQRIQRPEGLIEQQQLGLGHQRPRQRYPLCLAARQRQRPRLGMVFQADLGQRLLGALPGSAVGQLGPVEAVAARW